MQKSKFNIDNKNLYLTLLVFESSKLPDIFLIPSEAWKEPNEVFVDRKYDKAGQKSAPEYGVNISQKNYDILEMFKFEESICERKLRIVNLWKIAFPKNSQLKLFGEAYYLY